MLIRTASLIKQTMAKYEEGDNSNTVGENETDSSHCVNSIQVPQRTGNTTISIQRIKIHVKKTSTHMPMFIAVLVTIAKI